MQVCILMGPHHVLIEILDRVNENKQPLSVATLGKIETFLTHMRCDHFIFGFSLLFLIFLDRLKEAGINCPVVTIGSTPSCSKPPEDISGVTEFHPGNYVFYGMQVKRLKNE